MDVLVVGVVRKIASEQDEVETLRQGVNHLYSALKSTRAQGVRWAIEADMRIAELNEGEGSDLLAVGLTQGGEHAADLPLGQSRRIGRVQHADAERGTSDFEKRPSVMT